MTSSRCHNLAEDLISSDEMRSNASRYKVIRLIVAMAPSLAEMGRVRKTKVNDSDDSDGAGRLAAALWEGH